jgi:hypothetical protein
MSIYFIEENHKYASIENDPDQIEWTSVTTLIEMFSESFDALKTASDCSSGKSKTKKYLGLPVNTILDLWDAENKRATDLGSRYHLQKEIALIDSVMQTREGLVYPVYPPVMQGSRKLAIPQKLEPGIYPEHMMYLKSAKICGQSDRVEIIQNFIDVFDHKTNKAIELESYRDRLGKSKKLKGILSHLDDCNYIHYSVQLSIYMYMLRKHNYNLIPRKLVLEHVRFALDKYDKYGFPIYHLDSSGNPIVEDITNYSVDYMEREVISILNFIKENPYFLNNFKKNKHKHESRLRA